MKEEFLKLRDEAIAHAYMMVDSLAKAYHSDFIQEKLKKNEGSDEVKAKVKVATEMILKDVVEKYFEEVKNGESKESPKSEANKDAGGESSGASSES